MVLRYRAMKEKRLDMHSRNELTRANYKEYHSAGKKAKGEILSRLSVETGLNKDYLATKLRTWKDETVVTVEGKAVKLKTATKRKPRTDGKKGGRKAKYKSAEFEKTLEAIWNDQMRQCGKLLKPTIAGMIEFLAAEPKYGITAGIKGLLLSVSAAEIDILLAPAKKMAKPFGISTTKTAQTPLRSLIPVLVHYKQGLVIPGYFNFDTVAHCGWTTAGEYCKTLTGTDTYSGWIEERSLLNTANKWVKEAYQDIWENLPFAFLAAHHDNGSEFINWPLYHWCQDHHIEVTRSRAYKKNDNCFAEQKNFDAVRKTVGYARFDTQEECDALAAVYRSLCPLYNYWWPSFKLIDRIKQADGQYKKVYEKEPKTPYQRLLDCPSLSDDVKDRLKVRKSWQNPVDLASRLNKAVQRLLQINAEKDSLKVLPLAA
jgi:hypothetical protein